MKRIKDALKGYLLDHQPNFGHEEIHSLLEMLWDSYTMHNPIDNEMIRDRLDALQSVMDTLTDELENTLFDVVSTLCAEYERAAFLEGLRTGVRLAMELTE